MVTVTLSGSSTIEPNLTQLSDGHRRIDLSAARRIGIMRLDNAGDVVLAGPTIRALRAHIPGARLVLLASVNGAAGGELLPWLDEIEVWRAVWQDAAGELPFDPERERDAIERLRALELDAIFILTSFSQTPYAAGYAAYLAGIPTRIGHEQGFGGGVLSHAVKGPAPDHQAERNLHLVGGVGLPIGDAALEVRIPPAVAAGVNRTLSERGAADGTAIVVAPGASCGSRRYAAGRLAQAVAAVRHRTGRPVVVIGSSSDAPLAAPLLQAIPDAIDLVGGTSLVEAAAVIRDAAVVVSNNSLAMHLADAFGRPIVVTFAGTEREPEWAPRRSPSALLRSPTPCAPCRLFECPMAGHPCLSIDPRIVADEAIRLLGEGGLAKGSRRSSGGKGRSRDASCRVKSARGDPDAAPGRRSVAVADRDRPR